MSRSTFVHVHHPGLGAVSEVHRSSLRAWAKFGWLPVDESLTVAETSEAYLAEPEPPEPQFVLSFGELVPADGEASAEVPVPEWTDSGASEVDEATVADADEELA
jgi:hypothetical protein